MTGTLLRAALPLTLVTALSTVLSGCVSFGAKPPPTLITLTARESAPAGALSGGSPASALLVLDPEVDRRIDVLRVAVQIDPANVAYLKNAQWVERPARQFRRLLAETLRARGKRLIAEGGEEAATGAATLSGRLIDAGYDARSSSVVVRFDAMRQDGPGTAVSVRRFEATVPGVAAKPEHIAPALNKAANDVAKQVADWVG